MDPRFDILHRSSHIAHCIMAFATAVSFHVLCSPSHDPLVVFIEEICLLEAFRDKEDAAAPDEDCEGTFDYIKP